MDNRTARFFGARQGRLAKVAVLSIVAGVVLAAVSFIANNQPWGYISSPALSSANFSSGTVVAYTPWFEVGTFRGDLLALPVGQNGTVTLLTPNWRASVQLDVQDFLTGRQIVTTDGLGGGIPFLFDDLTEAQQLQVGTQSILNYVRGDRSNESAAGLRPRAGVLGDIIHSTPLHVGKPIAGFNFGEYLSFASDNAGRAARVFVGANDGMLHAFDAATGNEVYAYVPSMVLGNLSKLTVQPYSHQYFVDGSLTVEDAQFGGSWHSVLVGGLGAGGKGFYALDVTSASAPTEAAAAGKILWEFHSGSAGADNLGYSYSRPSIVRVNKDPDQWAAVVANGYLSATGVASLYVLNVQTGAVIQEIAVPDLDANGLSSPTLIDTNADGLVDAAYAGDLNGNLWKFDRGPSKLDAWSIAYAGQPMFQTALVDGVRQAITTAPEVGRHPHGGVMVYVGTGRLFSDIDAADKSAQAVYGIWDNEEDDGTPIDIAQLRTQQLKSAMHSSGAVRVATANFPDWSAHRGWMTPTEIAGATSLDQGERVIQDLLLRDNRITFMSVNPSIPSGENWFIQLDALTGGAPGKTIIDVNEDFKLDVGDNVDGNTDGEITDVAEDRVVGQYQNFGLASRPVVGVLSAGSDAALINHLTAITPTDTPNPDDPGLLGGHFDLDTSRLIYPFSNGTTDGHVHEWDDKHDLTTINYFDLPDGQGNPLDEINVGGGPIQPETLFMLTVANTDLSPGGVLEINGTSISVVNYRALENRYLTGTLAPSESFPVYKRNKPSDSEASNGVVQLLSLKLSFDAFAILSGDIIPTVTGCVRGNDQGALGEYRNGALMIQALDASDISGGFVFDDATQRYIAGSTQLHSTLGYAMDGLLWESTVFWHWDGPCYGTPDWAPLYDSCIVQGQGGCTKGSKEQEEKGKKKKKKQKDDDSPPDVDLPTPSDPGHSVTNTTVGGNNDVGRLFWRELIPEE